MFKRARIKLTAWYLVIIMTISVFFSLIIYNGATVELQRIEDMQRLKRPQAGLLFAIEPEIIQETKERIQFSLLSLNGIILVVSGLAGYFLAGKTLDPIKQNMEEQKNFVSNASHELRTPLTSLKTEIEVALRNENLNLKTARKNLRSNLNDVNRMTSLAEYLLKLSKFDDSKERVEMRYIDLRKVALEAVGKRRVEKDLKKTIVWGNSNSLIELIMILLDNAFKYSGNNPKVTVRVKNKTLWVEDNGEGISKEDIPYIFDRFYQGDKSRAKGGYGLGLSIAKSIIDLNQAKISVYSKPQKGSIFKVTFS